MAVPTGYSQGDALKRARSLSNEYSLPDDPTVIGFLNDGLEYVANELGALRQVWNLPINAAVATLQLPEDIYIADRYTWSTVLPTTAGAIEYPIQELGPGGFVEQAGGLPTVSGGNLIWCRTLVDESGQITLQFYPLSPSNGYINVYGRQRPTLYDPNTPASVTNLEPSLQLLAIYFAVIAVCENRENYTKAQYYAQKLFGQDNGETQGLLGSARTSIQRRQKPRGSVVRDVTAGPDYAPPWMPRY